MNTQNNKEQFIKDTRAKVVALTNECNANGLYATSTYMEALCTLLLDQVAEYARSESSRIMALIKTGKIKSLNPSKFGSDLKSAVTQLLEPFESIIANSTSQSGLPDKILGQFRSQLNFRARANEIIENNCNSSESLYAEDLTKKHNEQTQVSIAKRTFWVTSTISALALIVSVVSVYYSYLAVTQVTQKSVYSASVQEKNIVAGKKVHKGKI